MKAEKKLERSLQSEIEETGLCLLKNPKVVSNQISKISREYFHFVDDILANSGSLNGECVKCESLNKEISTIVHYATTVLENESEIKQNFLKISVMLRRLAPYTYQYKDVPKFKIVFQKLWNICHENIISDGIEMMKDPHTINEEYLKSTITQLLHEITILPFDESILKYQKEYGCLLKFCTISPKSFYKFSTLMATMMMKEVKDIEKYDNLQLLLTQILKSTQKDITKNEFFNLYPTHLQFFVVILRNVTDVANEDVWDILKDIQVHVSETDFVILLTHDKKFNSLLKNKK